MSALNVIILFEMKLVAYFPLNKLFKTNHTSHFFFSPRFDLYSHIPWQTSWVAYIGTSISPILTHQPTLPGLHMPLSLMLEAKNGVLPNINKGLHVTSKCQGIFSVLIWLVLSTEPKLFTTLLFFRKTSLPPQQCGLSDLWNLQRFFKEWTSHKVDSWFWFL